MQLVEVYDAETALVPDRLAALLGTAVLVAWGLRVDRTGRASTAGDVAIVLAIAAIGLGLGRNGAVLVGLIAVLPLRALHGPRPAVLRAACGVFVAYGLVTYVHHGLGRLLDPGVVVVVGAATAFTVTLHSLGRLLARHDLFVRLDAVATEVAAGLVATTTTSEVDRLERAARGRMLALGQDAAGHRAPDAVDAVLARLDGDLRLARQRITSEERYRTAAEANRDGLYLRAASPGAAYRYLNPAGEAVLGVSAHELRADPTLAAQLLHEDDLERLHELVSAEGFVAEPTEVRCRRPDGEERWISVQERLVDADDATQRTVLGVIHDVTQRREEAAALQRVIERERAALEHLRHLDAMKSTFLQAVSHELRTPLSAVIGAAQTLDARDGVLDARQRRVMLDIVQRQSARLERLLTDLLDVDRLSRGSITPDRRPTRLFELAEGVVAHLEPAEAARIELVGDVGRVEVDAPKVERIIENLLRNALRHTPADGRILCRITREDAAATIVVEDEGPGIPDELKTELFLPFSQGPTAKDAPSPGTGIGLALVRALAELHGGHARVEDRPSGGARFVVRLPADEAAARAEEARAGALDVVDAPAAQDVTGVSGASVA